MAFFDSPLPERLDEHAHGLARLAEQVDLVADRERRRRNVDATAPLEDVRRELRGRADEAAEMADEARGLDFGDRLPDD